MYKLNFWFGYKLNSIHAAYRIVHAMLHRPARHIHLPQNGYLFVYVVYVHVSILQVSKRIILHFLFWLTTYCTLTTEGLRSSATSHVSFLWSQLQYVWRIRSKQAIL